MLKKIFPFSYNFFLTFPEKLILTHQTHERNLFFLDLLAFLLPRTLSLPRSFQLNFLQSLLPKTKSPFLRDSLIPILLKPNKINYRQNTEGTKYKKCDKPNHLTIPGRLPSSNAFPNHSPDQNRIDPQRHSRTKHHKNNNTPKLINLFNLTIPQK